MSNGFREFTGKERAWLKRFDKVMKDAPKSLFLFVGSGMVLYVMDENNQPYMTKDGGVDSSATGQSIKTTMKYDGGDY